MCVQSTFIQFDVCLFGFPNSFCCPFKNHDNTYHHHLYNSQLHNDSGNATLMSAINYLHDMHVIYSVQYYNMRYNSADQLQKNKPMFIDLLKPWIHLFITYSYNNYQHYYKSMEPGTCRGENHFVWFWLAEARTHTDLSENTLSVACFTLLMFTCHWIIHLLLIIKYL